MTTSRLKYLGVALAIILIVILSIALLFGIKTLKNRFKQSKILYKNIVFIQKETKIIDGISYKYTGLSVDKHYMYISGGNDELEGAYGIISGADRAFIVSGKRSINFIIGSILLREGGPEVCVYTKTGPVFFVLPKTIDPKNITAHEQEILGFAEAARKRKVPCTPDNALIEFAEFSTTANNEYPIDNRLSRVDWKLAQYTVGYKSTIHDGTCKAMLMSNNSKIQPHIDLKLNRLPYLNGIYAMRDGRTAFTRPSGLDAQGHRTHYTFSKDAIYQRLDGDAVCVFTWECGPIAFMIEPDETNKSILEKAAKIVSQAQSRMRNKCEVKIPF